MDIEEIREYAISKTNTQEGFPFGEDVLVFKVNGKIFLILALFELPISISLKCDPDKAIELREQYDCVIPGYHLNKKHWNTVIINGQLNKKQLKEMIDHSYDLVSKRK